MRFAEIMRQKEGVRSSWHPAMIRIDAGHKLEFVME